MLIFQVYNFYVIYFKGNVSIMYKIYKLGTNKDGALMFYEDTDYFFVFFIYANFILKYFVTII